MKKIYNYRPEIDGLRALAIIPVVLYHSGIKLFEGGYVGVDVFFVISGYLITSIIVKDLNQNSFSIIEFYKRRARRILPALITVSLISIILAWYLMLPNQMKEFSQSIVSVYIFLSNFFFYKKINYFQSKSDEFPLLHTWSLSIEEQFYLVFPFILIFIWKFFFTKRYILFILISLMSFSLCVFYLQFNARFSFYMLPTRAWELLAGSITALLVLDKRIKENNFYSILGLILIIYSIFTLDKFSAHPSIITIIPVFGCVLIILFAKNKNFVSQILSSNILVSVGLISYSLYLWHQPLFAFARIKLANDLTMSLIIILVLLSIILSFLTWKYIEKPIRTKNTKKNKHLKLIFCCFIFFISFGLIGHLNDGFFIRFDNLKNELFKSATFNPKRAECHFPQEKSSLKRENCEYFFQSKSSVAVLGNSHATELAYTLAEKLKNRKISVSHFTISGCKHNYLKIDELDSLCNLWHQKVLSKIINDLRIETVILSYRNEKYLDNYLYRNSLKKIINELINNKKKVFLVLQAPLAKFHIDKHFRLSIDEKLDNIYGLNKDEWNNIYVGKDKLLDEISNKVTIIDPSNLFCPENKCFVIKNNKALYFDEHHMSLNGAKIITDEIISKF